jgi:lipopolysaccharide transport system permease protein
LQSSSDSIVSNSNLIKKIYFPRLVVPIAGVLSGLIDFAIAFVVLLGMMLYYGLVPTINILWLPLFVILTVVTALGTGLWLSALNVKFRDVRYTLGFLTQLWMYATPIAYPSNLLSEPWKTIYGINPMAGVVEGFRWALLGTATPPGYLALISAAVSLIVLVSGACYFRRMEADFADVV